MSETTLSPRAEASASGGDDYGAAKSKRILLVEGDGFTRIVLLLRLRLAGFKVDFTSNGYLGLGKLRTCRPDILLLELKLCGLSGLDLIKAARAEPGFGNRPIYVFTHVDRMNRTARKELLLLVTKVFDKSAMSREDLVQTFASMFLKREAVKQPAQKHPVITEDPVEILDEEISSQEIEEIVAGVREQSELLVKDSGGREASGKELLSRVSSLKSCAEAARLPNLTRHARGLENFLHLLCKRKQAYTDGALRTVSRAVQVMSRIAFKSALREQKPVVFKAVLVDEAPKSNQAVEKALRDAGFSTVSFEDARLARDHLSSKRADLIVANLALPEAHGLSFDDIRQLPLHAETPVLFAPEATIPANADDELPTSAPRLDAEPLLLAELILNALNEVQSPQSSYDDPAKAPNPSLRRAQPDLAQSEACSPSEDGFELFAKGPADPFPIDPSIPAEPFLRAEPSGAGPDQEAEFLIQLPEAATIDGVRGDERPLEALPPAALFIQAPEAPQPESADQDQATSTAWTVAAAQDIGGATGTSESASAIQQNEAAAIQELSAAEPNYGEVMNNQLEATSAEYVQQVDGLRRQQHPREDLAARVCAAEMALYHAKADAERKGKTIEALQSQLAETMAQRTEPNAVSAEPSEAEKNALARCAELEQEIASLRQAFEGFGDELGQPPVSAELDKRVQELEERLNHNTGELEKQKADHQQSEAQLRQQLEAAKSASQPVETARQEAEARCAVLEQELIALRKAHDEQASKAKIESGAATGLPETELEQQVRLGVAALAKATAELAKERGERQRSQQRAAELNGRLQALHDDLRRTLQSQREDLARIAAVEEENRQMTQTLEQRTADVEQQKAEHFLAEEQLQKLKEANTQLRKDLAFFEETSKKFGGGRQELQARLEATLNTARENEARLQRETTERQRLAESLEIVQRDLQNQQRRREGLEQELKATQEALQDREAKMLKESAERQRLNEALRSAQGNPHDRSERDLEMTKLQSSLEEEQVERKRQETQLARIRQKAVDAAHVARALRTNLRRQIRGPVDNLVHSSRLLLELELGEEQKQLAESLLQDVMLVQTRLREPDPSSVESPEANDSNSAT